MSRKQQALRASETQIAAWKEAAGQAGVSLNQWMVNTLNEAAHGDTPPGATAAAGKSDKKRTLSSMQACPRAAQHRPGVWCKTCGETPT